MFARLIRACKGFMVKGLGCILESPMANFMETGVSRGTEGEGLVLQVVAFEAY